MRLIDLFTEIFAYVATLIRQADPDQPPFDSVRQDLDRLFARAAQRATQADVATERFDNARFAVCAWVDESILCSSWQGRTRWLKEPLQRRLYDTANAGEELVTRLAQLEPEHRQVREVYTQCLLLGFTGPFFGADGQQRLEMLTRNNLKLLWGETLDQAGWPGGALFPSAYPPPVEPAADQKKGKTRIWTRVALMAAAPMVLLLLFWIYSAALHGTIADFFAAAQ